MTYYHWASEPVGLRGMKYPQSGQPKPNGLWFDVNGAWKRWCESVDFRLDNLRYRHTVTVVDASRIRFLGSAKDVDAFHREFGHDLSAHIRPLRSEEENDAFARGYGRDLFGEVLKQFSSYIPWDAVAARHSGIIVRPYLRTKGEAYLWYHGLYCACGCVWDTGVIRLGKPCAAAGGRPRRRAPRPRNNAG